MKNTRRLLSIILCIALFAALFSVTAMAESSEYGHTRLAEGNIGENDEIYWSIIRDEGITALTINGNGTIPDYASPEATPWAKFRTDIEVLNITESLTYIGSNAFSGFTSLENIYFYGNAPEFGENVFADVASYCFVDSSNETWNDYVRQDYGGQLEWYDLVNPVDGGLTDEWFDWVYYSNGMLTIFGDNATVDYASPGDTPWAKYKDEIVLVELYNTTHIGNNAFAGLSNLEKVFVYSDSAPYIGKNAFGGVTTFMFYTPHYTWTDEVMQNYGGELTWVSMDEDLDDYILLADGRIGEDIYWYVYSTFGTVILGINGNGMIPDYASPDALPWADYLDVIMFIDVDHSPSYIGNNVFSGYANLTGVQFYGDSPKIGPDAFAGTSTWCYYDGDNPSWTDEVMQDYGGSLIWLVYYNPLDCGKTEEGIMYWAVYSYGGLSIDGDLALKDYASPEDAPWAKYRDIITFIDSFEPTYVGKNAFANLPNLEKVYFYGPSAPEFAENAFAGTEATAFYSGEAEGWNDDVFKNYGGNITWKPYDLHGDANGDGEISNADLILVARYVVHLIEYGTDAYDRINMYCDMDDDGDIGNTDIIFVARIIVGLA